jgi:hypothetical protein
MDAVPPVTNGEVDVPMLGWEDDARITVTQDTNQPATLVALVSNVWFGDE